MAGGTGGRFRRKAGFSAVSNVVAKDLRLSLKAKGLYLLIQAYITIPEFTLYKSFLVSQCIEGKSAFNSAWNELKNYGYLLQYRMRDEIKRQFYYEYELLDEPREQSLCDPKPVAENRDAASTAEPVPDFESPQKPVDGFCGSTKQGTYNQTIKNKTINNHTIPNHILSATRQQIHYFELSTLHDGIDMSMVDEIVMVIAEVYAIDKMDKIRVQRRDMQAGYIQERLKLLTHNHIAYVVDKIVKNTSKVNNPKAYLLTMLYNAPATMETDLQFCVSHDLNSH